MLGGITLHYFYTQHNKEKLYTYITKFQNTHSELSQAFLLELSVHIPEIFRYIHRHGMIRHLVVLQERRQNGRQYFC